MVRVRIRNNLRGTGIRAEQLVQRGEQTFINQVYADTNKYVPMKSSDLRNQSYINEKQIIWNTPYARRLYYEQFQNYTTPGTGPRWDMKAKSVHMSSWIQVVRRAMR